MVKTRINASQTVTQGVHATQALLEGHGTLHGRTHQVHAGFFVLAICCGTFNVRPSTL